MSNNTQHPIREPVDGDPVQNTELALRKRAASNALYIRVDKRPRHEQSGSDEPLEQLGYEDLRDQVPFLARYYKLTEDDYLYCHFEREVADIIKDKASKYDPTHVSDPGYDQSCGYTNHWLPKTTVVEEPKSYIICDSPQEALKYFKTNEKDVRRRIKHIIFSPKAVAFGPSLNGMHWKGLCNYIQKYMCIESMMIPVPHDPLSVHAQRSSSENDDSMEETTEDCKSFPPCPDDGVLK